jgi:pteridine reductase
MVELRGKRALVTGAGRRVGAEIAVALGEHAMQVAVHYQSARGGAEATAERIRAAGGQAVLLSADLRDRQSARGVVDAAIQALGGLDLLVLSAASFERVAFGAIDDRAWDETLALNLNAPFAMAQRAAPALRAARGGIVLITCASRLGPYRDYLPYQISKAALHHLMRLLALELAPEVRVNAVAPGSVLPPDGWQGERTSALLDRIPLGRIGSARDVADAVVHLAQSEWVTGTEIVVDGGRSLS